MTRILNIMAVIMTAGADEMTVIDLNKIIGDVFRGFGEIITWLGFWNDPTPGSPGYIVMRIAWMVGSNWIIGVLLAIAYIALAYLYFKKLGGMLKKAKTSMREEYGFKIFPVWHVPFYLLAASAMRSAFFSETGDRKGFLIAMAVFVAIPQLYILIRKPSRYPMVLLMQAVTVIYYAVALYLFSVLAFAALCIAGLFLMLSGMGDSKKHCNSCGKTYRTDNAYGSCPYCGN